MKRAEVVIVDFPFSDRTGSKVRPAVVVQVDALNQSRSDTILAIITSSSSRRQTEVFVDVSKVTGTGLRFSSFIQCDTLVTLDQSLVLAVIGRLPNPVVQQVDDCLKTAPGL
jgi:mRNA interferase MazF